MDNFLSRRSASLASSSSALCRRNLRPFVISIHLLCKVVYSFRPNQIFSRFDFCSPKTITLVDRELLSLCYEDWLRLLGDKWISHQLPIVVDGKFIGRISRLFSLIPNYRVFLYHIIQQPTILLISFCTKRNGTNWRSYTMPLIFPFLWLVCSVLMMSHFLKLPIRSFDAQQ